MIADNALNAFSRMIKKTTAPSSAIIPKSDSTADEIRKFKELLDDGIITQEEFNVKKKQLLGLQ